MISRPDKCRDSAQTHFASNPYLKLANFASVAPWADMRVSEGHLRPLQKHHAIVPHVVAEACGMAKTSLTMHRITSRRPSQTKSALQKQQQDRLVSRSSAIVASD